MDWFKAAADLAGVAAGNAIGDLLKFLAGWTVQVLTEMINFVGTWWLKIGAPDMGEGTATARVQSSTLFFVGVAGVIGMVFALMKVARDQDRGSTETWLMGMVRTVLVTAIAVPMVSLLLRVSDTVSPWLVRTISGSAQEDGLGKAMGLESLVSSTMTLQMAGLILFVVPLALLGSIINAVIVIFSYGIAIALSGLLPIFAAASQTERGKKSFDKAVAWLIAVVLFKPAAAVLYGSGLALMKGINGTGDSDTANALISLLTGLVMILSTCVAMPAMARVLVPAVGAGPQGMGGSGLAMLGGAVAIGAVTAGVGAAGAGVAAAASSSGGAAAAGAAAAETAGGAAAAGGSAGGAAGGGGAGGGGAGGGSAGGASAGGAAGAGGEAGGAASGNGSAGGAAAAGGSAGGAAGGGGAGGGSAGGASAGGAAGAGGEAGGAASGGGSAGGEAGGAASGGGSAGGEAGGAASGGGSADGGGGGGGGGSAGSPLGAEPVGGSASPHGAESGAGGLSGAEPLSSSGTSDGPGGSGVAEGYRGGAPDGADKSAINKQRLEFALREASRDIENGMESGNDL